MNALEAQYAAQKIVFGPIYFQVAVALKELGLLELLAKHRKGCSMETLLAQTTVSAYGVQVLLEAACAMEVVRLDEEERYHLTAVGRFLKSDQMTEVNLNFVKDVCYTGMANLAEAIKTGTPAGLKQWGDWQTVYEGLAELPEAVQQSWLAFDHYYSDDAFQSVLEVVFARSVGQLYDVGANTGRWARACCAYDAEVVVTLIDLPQQLELAKAQPQNSPYQARMQYYPIDLLEAEAVLPKGADVLLMSQLLDCFSPEAVVSILEKVHQAVTPQTDVYILEPCWDNQRFAAARYCLVGTSLYFTAIANGNSKFYRVSELKRWSVDTGFEVVACHEQIGGSYHTLFHLRKRN